MDKKSKVLVTVFILALLTALGYSYQRYISTGDFLIDESQVEAEEEVVDETMEGETLPGESEDAEGGEAETGTGV